MSDNNNIINELEEMGSKLATIPRRMPYSVPDGYFSAEITIPNGLPARAETPYSVPGGYFDELPQKMLAAAKATEPAPRTIAFAPRLQWLQAAALALFITAGGFIMFRGSSTPEERLLASVSKADIKEYIEYADRDAEPVMNAEVIKTLPVDNKEIVAYLDETGWE